LRYYLKLELETAYQVLEADNGENALQLAFENIPDLVNQR
jgi:response regulator RpfG family c-di-GMP phosphodiesterase